MLVAKDGQLLRRNMRREFLTEEELMEYFRRAGIEDAKDGRAAHVEANGHISLIRNKRSS
nr:YetF domain-containing protein [Pontibacter sp. FD36]